MSRWCKRWKPHCSVWLRSFPDKRPCRTIRNLPLLNEGTAVDYKREIPSNSRNLKSNKQILRKRWPLRSVIQFLHSHYRWTAVGSIGWGNNLHVRWDPTEWDLHQDSHLWSVLGRCFEGRRHYSDHGNAERLYQGCEDLAHSESTLLYYTLDHQWESDLVEKGNPKQGREGQLLSGEDWRPRSVDQ